MRCAKATSLLQAYLDNELTASQEARLEHHLKGCALCRMQLTAFRSTGDAMDLWTPKETLRDLISPVIQKLRYEQEAPSAFERFVEMISANRRKILVVSANLIILLLVVFNVPLFFKTPYDRATINWQPPFEPKKPVVKNEPILIAPYDPVDMAASFNDAVDAHNLCPVDRDMIVDNLINDANDISNGTIKISATPGEVRYRRVQVIYLRNSKDKPVVQRVIFTQQTHYEKTK